MKGLVAAVAFFAAYLAAAKFGLSLASLHPSATPVWPPSGIAIAAALLLGRPAWVIVFAAAFIVNVSNAGTVATSLGIAAGNTLEAIAGAYALRRWAGGIHLLERSGTIFRFAALMLPTVAVSATLGVTTLTLSGLAERSQYFWIWLTWWLGDLSGALIVVPLVLAWRKPPPPLASALYLERMLLFLVVCVDAALTFAGAAPGPSNLPIAFVTIPPLVWAAFRFGQRETTAAVAVMSTIATWGTVHGLGPFAVAGLNTSLLVAQAFVATLMTMMVPMAAVVVEWRRAQTERTVMLAREQSARRRAEASSSAKDDFLAMLSHELRNPLSAIGSAGHLLGVVDGSSEAAVRARDVINRQVRQLASLINDLLDVSRIGTGKIVLQSAPVNLVEIAARAVESSRLAAGRMKGAAALLAELPADQAVWVKGDATRLEQVVTNLLGNALKFTPAGGTIRLSLTHSGNWASLQVADTGIGIDLAMLSRVFERFVQADAGPASPQRGLGLGLTLVRYLVDLHGGAVSAVSEGAGRGSVFTVRLPLTSDRPGPSPAAAAPLVRRRVLIVEDQEDTRQMMRSALEIAGHEVFEAEDGPSAVAAIDRHVPDVAFVDLGLPGFDGCEVARQVRAKHGRAIRLIALTGYGQPDDRKRAEAAGFDRHLVKPVHPMRLAAIAADGLNIVASGLSRT